MACALTEDITFSASAPAGIGNLCAAVVGPIGPQQFWYWVVSQFPIGNVVNGPVFIRNAPQPLSPSNFVRIVWTPAGGRITPATYYVVRTTTPQFPTLPAICSLTADPILGTTIDDAGEPLNLLDEMPLAGGAPAVTRMGLNNRDYPQPTLEIGAMLSAPQVMVSQPPTADNEIVNKGYLDQFIAVGDAPDDGIAYGRLDEAWAPVVQLSGDTMTGPLILSEDPAAPLEAATKQYVDGSIVEAKTRADADYVLVAGDTMTGLLQVVAPISQSGLIVQGGNAPLATASFVNPVNGAVAISTIGGIFCTFGGLNLGSVMDAGPPTDLTKHIRLWAAPSPSTSGFGFSVSSGQLNYVINASTDVHAFVDPAGGANWLTIALNNVTTPGNITAFNYFASGQGFFLGASAVNGGFYVRGSGVTGVVTIRCASSNIQPTIENNSGGGSRNIVDTLGATFSGALYAPAFNVTSDIALKQDLEVPSLAELATAFAAFVPKRFRRIDSPAGRREWGLIAQDIASSVPDAVSGEDGAKAYSVSDVLAIAIGKIRHDEQRIRELEEARLSARIKRAWRKLRNLWPATRRTTEQNTTER